MLAQRLDLKGFRVESGYPWREDPGRKTVARTRLEQPAAFSLHRHFAIDHKGLQRMMINCA